MRKAASLGIQEPDELDVSLVNIMEKVINDEDIAPEEGIMHHPEGIVAEGYHYLTGEVLDDDKMAETVESVRKYGILISGIVRPYPQGGYEVIAGHRRWRACELAGLEEMPVIIRDLDDDAATVIMVDTNIQMYIRLAELEKELPDYVDTCKIPLTVGEKLSYLKREEQKWAAEAIKNSGVFPSKSQAEQLKTFRQPIQKPRLFCV